MTLYSFLADVVVVLHFAYAGFVVVGMVVILAGIVLRWKWVRNFWFRMVHFLMIGLVVAESLGGMACPMTTWEYDLRVKAGQAGEPGSFIGRWFHRVLYYDAPEWTFTVCYCLFGTAVLATLILAPPRWPWAEVAAKPRQPA
jgi:hypothetical protein